MDSARKEGIRHAASFQLNSQVHPSSNRFSPRQTVTLEFGVRKGIGLSFCPLIPCRLYDSEDGQCLVPEDFQESGERSSNPYLTSPTLVFFLTGVPNMNSLSCGVGASGAVYGIMGAATGLRGVILIIFIAGLDLFAGGGFFAHIGGLIT